MNFLPGSHQTLFSKWEQLKLFIAHMVENHKRDWNPEEPRDFIDAYLKEIEKVRKIVSCALFLKNKLGTYRFPLDAVTN